MCRTLTSMVDPSKFLDWIKLSPRYLVPIFLFTGFVLFAPPGILDRFGLTQAATTYRLYFGVAFLLSTFLLLTSALATGYDALSGWRKQRRRTRDMQQTLHRLSEPEKEILRGYIEGQTTTQYLEMSDGVVGGLEAQRIIYRSSNIGSLGSWAYNIQPWAWGYLNEHPELLSPVPKDETEFADGRR